MVEVECWKESRDQIVIGINVREIAKTVRRRDWELGRIIQPRVEEAASAM